MWSALLGAAAFAGGFESTYSSAPRASSVGGLTTLGLCVAVEFVVAGLVGTERGRRPSNRTSTDEQTEVGK